MLIDNILNIYIYIYIYTHIHRYIRLPKMIYAIADNFDNIVKLLIDKQNKDRRENNKTVNIKTNTNTNTNTFTNIPIKSNT